MTRIANRSLVFNKGSHIFDGSPLVATSKYSELFNQNSEILIQNDFKLNSIKIQSKQEENAIRYSEDCKIIISISSELPCDNLLLKIVFSTASGQIVAEFSSKNNGNEINICKGENTISLVLENICLLPQKYYISFTLIKNKIDHLFWCRNVAQVIVQGKCHGHQAYQLKAKDFSLKVQ
jgi:hypothetical protein